MTAGPSDRPQTCSICGAIGTGNFCASCGHELTRPALSWIERLPIIGDRTKFIASIGRMIRRPISEPLKLATTPSYRDQYTLVLSALAVWLAFTYLVGFQSGNGTTTPAYERPSDVLLFIDLAVTSLLAWALFRMLSPETAKFDAHIKLWLVLAAFYLVGHVLVIFIASAAMLTAQLALPAHAAALQATVPTISYMIFHGVQVAMLVHYSAVFSRLWSMPMWQAGLILFMAWWLARYPIDYLQSMILYVYGFVAGAIHDFKASGT